jgi:hypothetical protein
MDELHVFLDTMIFLQFRSLLEVDWCEVLHSDSVRLLLAPVVLREIDNHKNFGSSSRLRRRARAASSQLYGLLSKSPEATVRPGVVLCRWTKLPTIDYAAHDLDPSCNDHMLLASALSYSREHTGVGTVVLSEDAGVRLRALDLGLQTFTLPEHLRLSEEPDPDQAEIARLRKRVAELSTPPTPDLSLTFEGEATHLHIQLQPDSPRLDIDEEMRSIRARVPLDAHSPLNTLGVLPFSTAGYNAALHRFYADYETYLGLRRDHRSLQDRTIRLTLYLWNRGRAPAKEIEIAVEFPDGIAVLLEEHLEKAPKEPQPPDRRSYDSSAMGSAQLVMGNRSVPDISDLLRPRVRLNIDGPRILAGSSVRTGWRVAHLRHTESMYIGDIFARFAARSEVRSFHVSYTAIAENTPSKAEGKLHLVIGDTDKGQS